MNKDAKLLAIALDDEESARGRTIGRNGWVVAISFLVLGVGFAIQPFNGLLVEPRRALFHASTAAVLFSSTSLLTFMTGIGSPICGVLMQRSSIRTFMAGSMLCTGLGYIGLIYATHLWQVALINGVLFSAGLLTAMLAAYALIANWFPRHCGLAMGIASAGISVVGIVLPPLATVSMERWGFAGACMILALVAFLAAAIVRVGVVDTPALTSCPPVERGSWEAPQNSQNILSETWTVGRLMRSPLFWNISLISGVALGVASAIFNNLMPLAAHKGLSTAAASYLFSSAAAGGMIGLIGFGQLFDVLNQRTGLRVVALLMAAPCLLLLMKLPYPLLVMTAVLLGASLGAAILLPAILCEANFDRHSFGLVYGAVNPLMAALAAAAIGLFGWGYDLRGTYAPSLVIFLILLAGVFFAASLFPVRKTATAGVR